MEAIVNIVRMQTPRIHVRPLGRFALWANYAMRPIMQWVTYPGEEPQSTHFCNNTKLTAADVRHLDPALMVESEGDASACPAWLWGFIPLFHLPRFGGWSNYVVIAPKSSDDAQRTWYLGWIPADVRGVSRIPNFGLVRALRGQLPTYFFGVNEYGEQIPLQIVGHGYLGDGGLYAQVPLR